MKNSTRKIFSILTIAIALACLPFQVSANIDDSYTSDVVKDALIGGWEYSIEGAPEGYEKGFLLIVKQNGVYKTQVQISGAIILGENVVVKGNEITFDVMIEGEKVEVALEARRGTISGTITSPANGVMSVSGVKALSAE